MDDSRLDLSTVKWWESPYTQRKLYRKREHLYKSGFFFIILPSSRIYGASIQENRRLCCMRTGPKKEQHLQGKGGEVHVRRVAR